MPSSVILLSASSSVRTDVLDFSHHKGRGRETEVVGDLVSSLPLPRAHHPSRISQPRQRVQRGRLAILEEWLGTGE